MNIITQNYSLYRKKWVLWYLDTIGKKQSRAFGTERDMLAFIASHIPPQNTKPYESDSARMIREVLAKHDITMEKLTCRARGAGYVKIRTELIHRLCDAGFSYSAIGRILGRDHTTIMHHANKDLKATPAPKKRAKAKQ